MQTGGETPLLTLLTGYLNMDGRGCPQDGKGLRPRGLSLCRWDNGVACLWGFTFRCLFAAASAATAILLPTYFRVRFLSAMWIEFARTSKALRKSRRRWVDRWRAMLIPSTLVEGRRRCSKARNWSESSRPCDPNST